MTRKRILTIVGVIVGILVLAAIVLALLGPVVGNTYSGTVSALPPAPGVAGGEFAARDGFAVEEEALAEPLPTQVAMGGGGQGQAALPPAQERLIIRSADVALVVTDTQTTIDQIAGMADSMGGFVVSSNTYRFNEDALQGDITVRVPAGRFDEALDAIKDTAVEVNSETISGQDVTEEYVDLQARLQSLEAAEERLLEIMANAQNTTDLLQAEQQLTVRQAEIESIQGRLNFLEQSAALSRISVSLTPDVVAQAVDVGWRPLTTVRRSFDSLLGGLTGIVDAVIFIVIAVIPRLLIIAVLLAPFYFVGRALWRRRRASQ